MLHLGIAPLQPSKILRDWYSLRGLFFHLETAAKLLKLLERVLAVFSKCTLKLLDNQADFDSAIPRFESWRPSQIKALKGCSGRALLCKPKYATSPQGSASFAPPAATPRRRLRHRKGG
jgi:hypothetical protein